MWFETHYQDHCHLGLSLCDDPVLCSLVQTELSAVLLLTVHLHGDIIIHVSVLCRGKRLQANREDDLLTIDNLILYMPHDSILLL